MNAASCKARWCWAIFLWASAASAIHADESSRSLAESAAVLAPSPQQSVLEARERLQAALPPLRNLLTAGGPQKEAGWLEWLELPELERHLAASQPDVAVLARHHDRLNADRAGLELPPFVELRRSLQQMIAAAEFTASDAPPELFHQRLEELNDCLARLGPAHAAQDVHRAGRLVAWFDALGGNSAALAAEVRKQYCRNNALGQISARFVNKMLRRDVQCQQFIAETMLGSYNQGVAITRASVSVGFEPSTTHGTLELRMQGHTSVPSNVAQRRRISVFTSAGTTIHANKQVILSPEGFQLAPTAAGASSSVQINDIDAGRRIVERLAWRRASRMLPEAESAVSQRARTEATTRLDEEAAAGLAGINNLIRHQIRAPLIRQDALPQNWRFWTDRQHLRISLAQHNHLQLAPATTAPQFPESYDIAVAAHDSMVVNLSEALLGGETFEDCRWLEFAKHLVGYAPPKLAIQDHSQRWSVTFTDDLPIIVRFADNRIAFTLRLSDVMRGGQSFDQPIEIEACYRLDSTPDGIALIRDGQVTIRLPDEGRPLVPIGLVSQTSLASHSSWQQVQSFLAEKFDAIIPAELRFHGMSAPAGGTLAKLRLLQLAEFKSAHGWLTLAYQLKNSE